MKRVVFTAAVMVLALAAAPSARAEAISLSVDGAVNVPVGDWADASGIGIGALLEGEMSLIPLLTLTGRVGYIYGMSKEHGGATTQMSHIPVLAGVKYTLVPTIYLAGEAGFVNNRVEVDMDDGFGGSGSDDDTDLAITLGAGMRMGTLDLRGQLFFPDIDHMDDLMGLLFTVGYKFYEL